MTIESTHSLISGKRTHALKVLLQAGKISLFITILGLGLQAESVNAEPLPPMQNRTNIALGKKVLFSPAPNYGLTKKSDTDATDLTDGKISQRPDHALWFESSSVGWSYPGRVNLAVDLGKIYNIDEVAIRLQNGSPSNGGRKFPGWVEAFVSVDGENYTKVSEFSQWKRNDFKRFGIGEGRGESFVDCLRFKDLKTRGRWVGFRLYGTSLSVSDELYVFGTPESGISAGPLGATKGFTVRHPQVYFHKPYLELANNVALPVPIGLTVPDESGHEVKLDLDLPPGLEIGGGSIAKIDAASLKPELLPNGWRRYSFSTDNAKSTKVFGRLYLQASSWKDGQNGELHYRFSDAKWQSPLINISVRAVNVPAAPRLKTIMASLGWWDAPGSSWPNQLQAFKTIGLNTFNVMTTWSLPKDIEGTLAAARKQDFFISTIDSPFHVMLSRHKKDTEIFDQFQDGTVGKRLCISYRGQYYQQEIERFAQKMATVKPDFSSEDIELWSWTGPTDSMKCSRCQADYKASGFGSWADWQRAKGTEIMNDLVNSAQKAITEAGGKPLKTGMYDVRPGKTYQEVFHFDSLYPQLLNSTQVSTYSSLQPADLAFIGDEVRTDRARLPRSDVLPWISPGDAGTFSGDAFQWALLECYTNGSRGIWFWSNRVWDSESLIAYNKVIRAIAPVEDVIVKGDLVGSSAAVEGAGRISGMKLGSRMVLLAADYLGQSGDALKLRLNLPATSQLRDLFSGQAIGKQLAAGSQTVDIPLDGEQARLLEVVPAE